MSHTSGPRSRPSVRRGVLVGAALLLLPAVSCKDPQPPAIVAPLTCEELLDAAVGSVRYYADDAPWNVPATCLDDAAMSDHWSGLWFDGANKSGFFQGLERGRLTVGVGVWGTPVYTATSATPVVKVFNHTYATDATTMIPIDPAWTPSRGSDRELNVVDADGHEYGVWMLEPKGSRTCTHAGYRPDVDRCAAMAFQAIDAETGRPSDVDTGSGKVTNQAARGMGALAPMALLARIAEVQAGVIQHALAFDSFNTMFGPSCDAGQLGTAAAGRDCGYAVAPATKLENHTGPEQCVNGRMEATPEHRLRTVPGGMRFALRVSNEHIESWLATKTTWTARRKDTARIFAVALRDYGWYISDTACGDSIIGTESTDAPGARAAWEALGVPETDSEQLLYGLVTNASQVRSMEPGEPVVVHRPTAG